MNHNKIFEWARSNLEVFLVAFIMAMLIRCFCIEVFQIPSGSMEPTLHGDYFNGDRIIANKFSLYFKDLKRFDVPLFKYPLNKPINFIKRVVGLPDEEIIVHQGDIYFKPQGQSGFNIARKELADQQAIWIPLYEWDGSSQNLKDKWDVAKDEQNLAFNDGKVLLKNDDLEYRQTIKDDYPDGRIGQHSVSDVTFSHRFRVAKEGGEISVRLTANGGDWVLHLYPRTEINKNTTGAVSGQNQNSVEYKTTRPPASQSSGLDKVDIQPGRDYKLEMMYFDGSAYVILDEKVIFRYDCINTFNDAVKQADGNGIKIGVVNNEMLLWDITVGRDIYYACNYGGIIREDTPLYVPTGKYVMMGDNVPNSKDSRLWMIKRIFLKNGKVIECDSDPKYCTETAENVKIMRIEQEHRGGDVWGVAHTIRREDIADIQEEHYIFVDKTEIFGKGILVYWPPKRLKRIH